MPADALLAALRPLLATARFGRAARGAEALASTNTAAIAWAADADAPAPEGALVLAEHQTAGRGRHGRAWADAAGQNLLVSLVLRPPASARADLGWLPLAAALAVADAVAPRVPAGAVALKWPNDVLLGGRKVCGILAEAASAGAATTVVLGVGLNVNQAAFPPELADRATSLALAAGRAVERAPLLADLLAALEARYDALLAGATARLRADFEARMAGLGEAATVSDPHGGASACGRVLGLAPDGALRLATPGGERAAYAERLREALAAL